jgi:protein SCO1/2
VSTTSPIADAQRPSGVAPREGWLQRTAARLLGSRLFWVIFLLIPFGWPIVRMARTTLPPPLPILGTIGEFSLVEQNGQPFGVSDVRGRVWVLSAISTASPAADKVASELYKIQHRSRNLGPAFHLVTVGLDPEVDNRENLLEFTKHHRVSPRIWSFLSGDSASLREASAQTGAFSVTLVDQQMRVRGRYDLTEPGAVDQVLYHAGLLVNRGD